MQRKPKLKVNYIRVYQDKSDPKQKVGCSTPERPTRKYIIANQNKFKLDTDVSPYNLANPLSCEFDTSLWLFFSDIASKAYPGWTRGLPPRI